MPAPFYPCTQDARRSRCSARRPLSAACLTLCFALAVPALAQSPVRPGAAAPLASETDNSKLDAALFYQLLIGEIELRSGEAGTAYQVLLDAARKSKDQIGRAHV